MGDRNGRWAMIIEKDGTVSYAENESNPRQVTVSGELRSKAGEQALTQCHYTGLRCRSRSVQVVDYVDRPMKKRKMNLHQCLQVVCLVWSIPPGLY